MRQALLITMIIAIIFAFIIGVLTWWKINQFRKKSIKQNFTESYQNVWENDKIGDLLWELKRKTKHPLEDEQLIYAINTVFRNHYESTCVTGFSSDYEAQNLSEIGKQNISCEAFDFLLINCNKDLLDQLEIYLKSLSDKGMVLIANAPQSGNVSQQIANFCHQYKLRFNYEWVGKGIILIAK